MKNDFREICVFHICDFSLGNNASVRVGRYLLVFRLNKREEGERSLKDSLLKSFSFNIETPGPPPLPPGDFGGLFC